jgi:hypothetical protein
MKVIREAITQGVTHVNILLRLISTKTRLIKQCLPTRILTFNLDHLFLNCILVYCW